MAADIAEGGIDANGRKNAHAREHPRQGALDIPQLVTLRPHRTGFGLHLEDQVTLDVREILDPRRRHIDEVLLVGLVIPISGG